MDNKLYFRCGYAMWCSYRDKIPGTSTPIRVYVRKTGHVCSIDEQYPTIEFFAPNPEHNALITEFQNRYSKGEFYDVRDLYIPNEIYNDPTYWK